MKAMAKFFIFMPILFLIWSTAQTVLAAHQNDLIVVQSDSKETDSDSESHLNGDSMTQEEFIPTNEWQTIKPGQAIPAGLHIKIDLQNHKREAKLLSKDSDGPEKVAVDSFEENTDSLHLQNKKFSKQEMKEALKLLKNEAPEESVKHNFRSMEELKKEFAALKMNIQTEGEILTDLVAKYKAGHDKESILQDLEYLLHQYDLAQDFVKMNGIKMLLPDFNSTDSRIRSLVAFTLGSAMQGNPRVQISVLESNVMQHLLHIIALDQSPEVKARSLYALSCLLRNFPVAQKNFIASGGVAALADLFRHQQVASQKLHVKVITLLHDLLSEQRLTEQFIEGTDEIQKEKLRQYKSFQLEASLKENGFCHFLPKLLSAPDHDTQEKVITAMQTLVSTCADSFAGSLNSLKNLAESYKLAALTEVEENQSDKSISHITEDLYFLNLYSSVSDLISSVEQRYRDEL